MPNTNNGEWDSATTIASVALVIAIFSFILSYNTKNQTIRPYVGVESVGFSQDMSKSLNWVIYIKNVGNIPAKDVVVTRKAAYLGNVISENLETEKKVVMPNQPIVSANTINNTDIIGFYGGGKEIKYLIRIDYSGVNGSGPYFYWCNFNILIPSQTNSLSAVPILCDAN